MGPYSCSWAGAPAHWAIHGPCVPWTISLIGPVGSHVTALRDRHDSYDYLKEHPNIRPVPSAAARRPHHHPKQNSSGISGAVEEREKPERKKTAAAARRRNPKQTGRRAHLHHPDTAGQPTNVTRPLHCAQAKLVVET